MTPIEMQALVKRQLDAYNRRDLDEFTSCYHPEIRVMRLISNAVTLEGMDTFRESYKKLFESSPQLHCEVKNRTVLAEAVIDEEWVTGASLFPGGIHTAAIYGFRDRLIDRVWFTR